MITVWDVYSHDHTLELLLPKWTTLCMENMVSGQNEKSTLSQNHIFWGDNSSKPVTSSLPIMYVLLYIEDKTSVERVLQCWPWHWDYIIRGIWIACRHYNEVCKIGNMNPDYTWMYVCTLVLFQINKLVKYQLSLMVKKLGN